MSYFHYDDSGCFSPRNESNIIDEKSLEPIIEKASHFLSSIFENRENLPRFVEYVFHEQDLSLMKDVASYYKRECNDIIFLGTGGSSLGAQALYSLVKHSHRKGHPNLYFMDNIDPFYFTQLREELDWSKVGLVIISKSGKTPEVLSQFLEVFPSLKEAVELSDISQKVTIITEEGDNPFYHIHKKYNTRYFAHDKSLGGRYSVFSIVGLLPAYIMGLDGEKIRRGAKDFFLSQYQRFEDIDSIARAAALIYNLYDAHGISNTILMPYTDRLSGFSAWFRQLWAESLGKQGKGLTPIVSRGTADQHSQLQLFLSGPKDKLFTVISLNIKGQGKVVKLNGLSVKGLEEFNQKTMGDLMMASLQGTVQTLIANHCPTRVVSIETLNEEVMGALFMRFMLETITMAHLMSVNPYDQPAVEEGKKRTRIILQKMA